MEQNILLQKAKVPMPYFSLKTLFCIAMNLKINGKPFNDPLSLQTMCDLCKISMNWYNMLGHGKSYLYN